MKIAIIGPLTENTQDLIDEIEKRGMSCASFQLKELIFQYEKEKFDIRLGNISLDDFDIFIFRAFNKNFVEAQILANYLKQYGKTIVDEFLSNQYVPSKVFEAAKLTQSKIRYPETFQAIDYPAWMDILGRVDFPVIVKPIHGQKGQGIVKFENKEDALSFFEKNSKGFMLQECLDIDGDIRVFVVGDKVLGAMKRFVVEGDYRSNVSLGAKAEAVELTEEMKEAALRSARALKCEIAGVDLIENRGEIYVLEVNDTPQWQGFKKATGINPAKDIIDYVLKKYGKN